MSTFRDSHGTSCEIGIELNLFEVQLAVWDDNLYHTLYLYLTPHQAAEMAAELANKALEAMERLDKEVQHVSE
jgi:hypothetical protein